METFSLLIMVVVAERTSTYFSLQNSENFSITYLRENDIAKTCKAWPMLIFGLAALLMHYQTLKQSVSFPEPSKSP